jgi:small subunit ribosomal protein S16
MGKIRNPQYRIVVADARTKRDGRTIEYIGLYHPKEEPSRIEVNSERVQHWLTVGAQPSEPVIAILSKTGDWQKFKGLPAPTEPLKVAPARASRTAAYEVEAKAAAGLAEAEKPKKEPAKRAPRGQNAASQAAAGKAEPASPEAAPEPAPAEPAAEAAAAEPTAEAAPAEPAAEAAEADTAASAEAPQAQESGDAGTDAQD